MFGGSKTTTTTDMTTAAKWQTPYLQDAMKSAQDIYNRKAGSSWYTGPLHAGLDPLTQQAVSGVGDYSTGQGAALSGGVAGASQGLLGVAPEYLTQLQRYAASAGGDPTASNIAAAGQYANNPYLSQQIDAVGNDIRRTLTEQVMPSIDRDATATGNINSSRAGVAEGIAMRGAQETLANVAADMRGNAYSQGLGLAEQARSANLGYAGDAARLYGTALGQGITGAGIGQDMAYRNYDALTAAGQLRQQDLQGQYDADLHRWTMNDTRDMDLLNQYYGLVGSQSWGQHGKTVQKQSGAGLLGGVLGLASTGLGLYGKAQGLGLLGGAKTATG